MVQEFTQDFTFEPLTKNEDNMNKIIFLVFFVIVTGRLTAQTVYTGFIGEYPVEMVIDPNSATADAVYSYTNFGEPIRLNNGVIKNGKLIFSEKKENDKGYAGI